MKILRLTVEGVRNLPDGEISFAHPHTGAACTSVLITGAPGAGKTTVLEVIAMIKERCGGYGAPPDPRPFLRQGLANGRAELTLVLSESERAESGLAEPVHTIGTRLSGRASTTTVPPKLEHLLAKYSHDPAVPTWAYLPVERSLAPEGGFAPPLGEGIERPTRLQRDARKYHGTAAWLAEAALRDAVALQRDLHAHGVASSGDVTDSLAPLKALLAALVPTLRIGGADPQTRQPYFVRADGTVHRLHQLSSAERDGVLLATTFVRVGLGLAPVLLDRLDLHASGPWQGVWVQALSERLAGGQLIATCNGDVAPGAAERVVRLPGG